MPRAAGSILVALIAALILPTSVMAARAERHTDSSVSVFCDDLQSAAGSAYVNAWISDSGETFADLGFWAAPAQPGESHVTWTGWTNDGLMSVDGSSLEITFGVYSTDGDSEAPSDLEFVGDATFSAVLTPAGEPETYRSNDQTGNSHTRSSGSWQRFDVAGSLTLPDAISFDLGSCEIASSTEHWFSNQPTHSVSHSSELGLTCGWETDDGYVSLFAVSQDFGAVSTLWISSGEEFLFGAGTASISPSAFDATYDLYPGWDEADPVGTASASAVLTTMQRVSSSQVFGDSRFTAKGVQLAVSGSLTIDTGDGTTSLAMDGAACQASDVRFSELPARKERVEPVQNDTPETATPLKLGDKLLVSTTGATAEPEAPCLFDDGEGGTFEGPMTNTIWWRIEGTAGSLTIDTAGSSFDTMVAVYLADGTSVGEQVGCVDDVDESLQARITFDAAAGASYFVQTGGFDGSTGDLALLISEP